jgi:glycosyltransferase involved in cell wall biosynthesis
VIATSPGLGGAIAGARLARRHRAPLILLVHDLLAASDGYGPVGAAVERHALASADRILVTSEEFRAPIVRYGVAPERIRRLPSWVGADRSVLGRAEARTLVRWPTRARIALVIELGDGRRPERGEPSWAGALTRRLAERPDVRVVRAEELAPQLLPHAVVAADLLVLIDPRAGADPSEVGSCLAAGRPVVALAPRTATLARAVARSAGAGVCIRPGDEEGLADAIAGLTARAGLLDLMTERAQHHARRSPDRVAAMRVVDEVVHNAIETCDRESHSLPICDLPRSC